MAYKPNPKAFAARRREKEVARRKPEDLGKPLSEAEQSALEIARRKPTKPKSK